MKNNELLKWFAGVAFGAFLLAVIAWTASLTIGVMQIVLPHAPAVKWFALGLFDGGALTWLLVFIHKAKGTPQRGVSLLMTVLDLIGIVLMVIGGIYLGGQELANIPEWIGGALINGVIGATVLNLMAGYYFHASAPDVREAIQAQSLEDTLAEEALKQARVNVEREAQRLGAIMARRVTAQIKYRLALPMSESEQAEWEGETVDATAEEMKALPAPAPSVGVWAWLKSFFTRGQSQPTPSEPITTSPTSDSNSNDAPGDDAPNP